MNSETDRIFSLPEATIPDSEQVHEVLTNEDSSEPFVITDMSVDPELAAEVEKFLTERKAANDKALVELGDIQLD